MKLLLTSSGIANTTIHEVPLLLPQRLPKDAIVCAECETRYLGAQRCEGCGTFCRRLGPGAPCPDCDEPVALSDLVTTAPAPRCPSGCRRSAPGSRR